MMKQTTLVEASKIASAAGRDAGNRTMRAAGRVGWLEADKEAALVTYWAVLHALGHHPEAED